ncbi:DUF5074 domain-containing protein [Olleya sp. Bg11-27]|uniref:DUF5074 domain-containing protein n=1 Tax=Olleya sp. Bg11-27 TaxID=2058135 RepID=UPI000C318C62|nr:DUF5074 domain-containing protein [Olleya sp. Bg11-27]AUC77145.1 hypothetical protein CW732_16260 [Olleya sp. Bg11-27]
MKQFKKIIFLAVASAFFLTSCTSDDDAIVPSSEPLGTYENGYFVLNEGGSSSVTNSIIFVSEDGGRTNDVFRIENPDAEELGIYIQNIFFDDSRAFIVAGSGSVTVVDRYTFEYIATISTDLESPRYGVVVNGKAYVTNNGDFGTVTDDFLTVIDLTDYSTSTIVIGNYLDRISALGDKVITTNNAYGTEHSVSVVDTNALTVTDIDLGEGNTSNSIEVVGNGVYVLTGSGKFMEIDLVTNTIASTLDIPASITGTKNLDIDNNTVYFTADTSVYSFNLGDTTVSEIPVLTYTSTSDFGVMYGFAVKNDVIYIGDGADFSSNGTFYEYSTSGTLLSSNVAGLGPNGFYFN